MENNVLVDAKLEYTKTLCSILTPRLMEGIYSILEESIQKCVESDDIPSILLTFQTYLASIPNWSNNMLETEYSRIVSISKCDYIGDLISAIFVSHTKVLSSIKTNVKRKKFKLNIPEPENFIHKAYIEVARYFWKQPYDFLQSTKYSEKLDISKIRQQQNYRACEKIIEEAITLTIRKMLPVKTILSTYLGDSVDELTQDDNVEETVNHKLVKTLVEKEVLKYNQEKENDTKQVENENEDENENKDENDTKQVENENDTKQVENENDTKQVENENDTKQVENENENDTKQVENENDTKQVENENNDEQKEADENSIIDFNIDNIDLTDSLKLNDNEEQVGSGVKINSDILPENLKFTPETVFHDLENREIPFDEQDNEEDDEDDEDEKDNNDEFIIKETPLEVENMDLPVENIGSQDTFLNIEEI
jgi:hypothetical protein